MVARTMNTSRTIQKSRKAKPKLVERPLYFDELPDNATEHIVKHLLPPKKREKEWSNEFSLAMVIKLVQSGGSLRRVAQNTFRTVQYSVGSNVRDKRRDGAVFVQGKHKDVAPLLKILPVGIGEGIETLILSAPLPYAFTRAIATHCTGLRHLSFTHHAPGKFPVKNFCSIIAARGATLETLDVSYLCTSERVVKSVAAHCGGVKVLKLSFCEILSSLEPLWKSIKGNVRHVEIVGGDNQSKAALRALFTQNCSIQTVLVDLRGGSGIKASLENCSDLRKLTFRALGPRSSRALSTILAALGPALDSLSLLDFHYVKPVISNSCQGPRLKHLEMSNCKVDTPSLLSIVSSCPNVRIDLTSPPEYVSYTDTVIALGRAASSWTITREDLKSRTVFDRVGMSCPNLGRITLNISQHQKLSAETFSGLFSEPKPHLRHLALCHVGERSATVISSVLNVLAEKVDYLESLSYVGQELPLQPLRGFLSAQKQIKRLSFRCGIHCCTYSSFTQEIQAGIGSAGFWRRLVLDCVANPSLEYIHVGCAIAAKFPKSYRKGWAADAFAGVFRVDRSRKLSITVCESTTPYLTV